MTAVLRDPATYSSALGMGDLMSGATVRGRRPPTFAMDLQGLRVLISTDPPDHTLLRRLVSKGFAPRSIAALEPRIRQLADAMASELIDAGEDADLVAQLAYPLPVIVIAELLGIPAEERDRFKTWSDNLVGGLTGAWDDASVQASGAEMFSYFLELAAERTRRPGSDLISLLATQGREGDASLGTLEIVMFCVLLLVAGNETTTNLIGNGAQAIFDHPDQAELLRRDHDLMPIAVEETLRYDAPVQGLFRATTRPVRLSGTELPAQARLMVLFGSANRDSECYQDPDSFDIRRRSSDHVAFGSGIHLCLGAPLARLEARVTAETLAARVRRLEPRGPGQRVDSFLLRGFTRLPVRAIPR
ncbi:MAG: cytochrome P450 [Acidimicrobiales bacterium]